MLGSHVIKAQTISFVERGFERLGLGHQTVVCRGVHIESNRVRSRSLSPGGGLGGSGFWPFFPASSLRLPVPPFIFACIPYPLSTCRIDFSKTDTYPISPYPKWLGVVVKVEEHGSVRCRMLYCSSGSLLLVLFPHYDHFSF